MERWQLLFVVTQLLFLASALKVQKSVSRRESGALPNVHFIYTAGCNDYQLTQAVVLEHSWRTAGNAGRLTRIVEGCKNHSDEQLLTRSPLQGDPDFAVFFTKGDIEVIPHTGERYPARARPHALQQWLEDAAPSDDTVVALLDPDFVFLKNVSDHRALREMRPGRMLSAAGWGGSWDGTNLLCKHAGGLTSRKLDLNCELKRARMWNVTFAPEYKTGPVWFVFVSDLKKILPGWQRFTDFWPTAGNNGLMREQFALWRAAAMHHIASDFEEFARDSPSLIHAEEKPYIVHYFRTYGYKNWKFHKSFATSGWYAQRFSNKVREPLTCGAPLLQEPPGPPPAQEVDAWAIYTLMTHFNPAFMAYRKMYCPGEEEIFSKRGRTAFGLARLLSPQSCEARSGWVTRYRVDPDVPSSWIFGQALGGTECSGLAQAM